MNFFKKTTKFATGIAETIAKPMGVSPLNNKTYVAEIAEIHDSFASALTKMQNDKKQAVETAPSEPDDDKRLDALKEMGFKANPKIIKHNNEKENYEAGKRLIENFENKLKWAEYYMLKYPNYKFITHDLVLELCNKYGLAIAIASRFKENIPESNIDAMIKFKKDFDTNDVCIKKKEHVYETYNSYNYQPTSNLQEYSRDCFIKQNLHHQRAGHNKYGFKFEDCSPYLSDDDIKSIGDHPSSSKSGSNYVFIKGGIRMVANPQMFNIKEWEKFNADTKELEIDMKKWIELDPIMLMPVYTSLDSKEDGYLIITAWGDEASDPDVINERMN